MSLVIQQEDMQARQDKRQDKREESIWLTNRDLTVLRWVGEQYAVRLDTLQTLLGRHAQQPTCIPQRVGASTARRVLARWRRARLVAPRKFLADEPIWVWLTSRGLRQLGFTYRAGAPKVSQLGHLHHVNQVRLQVESRYRDAACWRSERHLRREYGRDRRAHIPDAEIVTHADAVIGVEIEMTQKSKRRTREIVAKLAHRYDRVWYFVNRATRPTVRAAIDGHPDLFRLYDLEQVVT